MKIPETLHFVGIGGVGMSAIAQVWHSRGYTVSGSDSSVSATVQRLQAQGVSISHGHAAANLGPDVGGVVTSTAVNSENPEVLEARKRGLPILHRSQVLGALMREKRSIAVSGTHGKTTTTGMLASVLIDANVDPTVLIGGDLAEMGGNARSGNGPFLVAEADESDKSIRNLWAEVVIVTNLEGDHLEHYRDLDEIIEVMANFINSLPEKTTVVACADCSGVQTLLSRIQCQVVTYGFSPTADYRIENDVMSASGSTFKLAGQDIALQVPGRHNIANAAAATLAARLFGVGEGPIASGLAAFTGVKRRFQTVGSVGGITVIDDYAHHPSEIKATLQAARLLNRRVHAVFQPHRHSRLEALLEDFARSFHDVGTVSIMDTYSAGEAPRKVTAASLAKLISTYEPDVQVTHTPNAAAVIGHLSCTLAPGDLVLLLGAGDINQVAQPLIAELESRLSPSAKTA